MDFPKLTGKKQIIEIEGKELTLTNLDKVFWPEEGFTKGDLISYYMHVSPYILPHLQNRFISMKRYPNGIDGKRFFQKEAGKYIPEWIKTARVYSESLDKAINYIVCDDLATLVYLANLANISLNPWLSKMQTQEYPDFATFDIDPSEGSDFSDVVEVALTIKKIMDDLGLEIFVKTTGATGIHVYVPLKPVYSYKEVRNFAEKVAQIAAKKNPSLITLERFVNKRQGKVYLDYLQNVKGKTLASVYSVRARREATVSTPLKWPELNKDLSPKRYNMKNVFERLAKTGDIWSEVLTLKQEIIDIGQKAA